MIRGQEGIPESVVEVFFGRKTDSRRYAVRGRDGIIACGRSEKMNMKFYFVYIFVSGYLVTRRCDNRL